MKINFPEAKNAIREEPSQWQALKEVGHFKNCPEYSQHGHKYNGGLAHDTAFSCICEQIAHYLDDPLMSIEFQVSSIEISDTPRIGLIDKWDKDSPRIYVPVQFDVAEKLKLDDVVIMRTRR